MGSVIGGYLPETVGRVLVRIGPFDRFAGNLIVATLAVITQGALTTILVHEASRGGTSGDLIARLKDIGTTSLRIGLRNPLVLSLLVAAGTWGVAFAGLETFWQPYLTTIIGETGAVHTGGASGSTAVFGFIAMGYFLSGAVGSAMAAGLSRALRGRLALAVALLRLACGALFVTLSFQRGVGAFTAVYLSLFCLNGLAGSPEDTLFNEAVPGAVRSTLLSFRSLFLQLGGALGALGLGFVSQYHSISLAWRIAGGVFALSALLFVVAARRKSPECARNSIENE